ncbi:MAG TPA: isochorismate synthase [Acidimicrobiales bacterium]|nr:isochorismate synthase [Acidimicrobiales bacterium]
MTDVRSSLRCTTVELDPADERIDLVAFAGTDGFVFEQEGHGLAGRGEAMRVELAAGLAGDLDVVAATLAAIEGDGVPVALGALPFDRHEACSLVVPSVVVRRDADGRQWRTTVGPVEGDCGTQVAATPVLPDGFSLTSPRSHPDWQRTIADAVDEIAAGRLDKVVVAREVLVEANRPIVVPDVLERLRALYPACVVFSVDGFLGASPELLVERRGAAVRSHPLAGTFPRSGDPHADALLAAELVASVKDQREHRFVIEEIDRVLRPLCAALDVPSSPSIMQLRNVLHLGTEIAGTLIAPAPSALALAAALHPTPAVAGTPTADALAWLAAHEGLERGRYAGPVGWVDAAGDGMFAIGIRSAEVDGRRARLFAGVGVVEGSDPRRELVETQLKLQAILAAVVRP